MTPTSLIPQEALALGINYPELCEQIALLPLKNVKVNKESILLKLSQSVGL